MKKLNAIVPGTSTNADASGANTDMMTKVITNPPATESLYRSVTYSTFMRAGASSTSRPAKCGKPTLIGALGLGVLSALVTPDIVYASSETSPAGSSLVTLSGDKMMWSNEGTLVWTSNAMGEPEPRPTVWWLSNPERIQILTRDDKTGPLYVIINHSQNTLITDSNGCATALHEWQVSLTPVPVTLKGIVNGTEVDIPGEYWLRRGLDGRWETIHLQWDLADLEKWAKEKHRSTWDKLWAAWGNIPPPIKWTVVVIAGALLIELVGPHILPSRRRRRVAHAVAAEPVLT